MFVEVVLIEERSRADALSDALLDAGALSVAIEDADAGGLDEQPLYGEPGTGPSHTVPTGHWKRSRIVALFDAASKIDDALDRAMATAGIVDLPAVERRDIADANWVQLTQSQFDTIAIDERLWVVPSWREPPPTARVPGAIVLRLDPGMAFGTGDHPTTRLCLAWLVRHVEGGERVIDYGCGSGILAIAAARLGAASVVGTDIDEQAVIVARSNAVANDVTIAFSPSTQFAADRAEIVVANILSNPLKVLAPLLASLVAPDGRLVLSGILERQWPEVAAVYAPNIVLEPWRVDDGWVCLVGRRPRLDGASR